MVVADGRLSRRQHPLYERDGSPEQEGCGAGGSGWVRGRRHALVRDRKCAGAAGAVEDEVGEIDRGRAVAREFDIRRWEVRDDLRAEWRWERQGLHERGSCCTGQDGGIEEQLGVPWSG